MEQGGTGRLVFQYLLFACLGLFCSYIWNVYYSDTPTNLHLHLYSTETQEHSLEEVSTVLQGTDCDHFQKEAQLPDNMKEFMGTKLRYQFNAVIKDESLVEHCRAIKLYGLIRHGTRYPTTKHVTKWEDVREKLQSKFSMKDSNDSRVLRELRTWTNPLYHNMVGVQAEPADLTEYGIKEQYCLGKRLRQRFPELLQETYSPLSHVFRSTLYPRTIRSALSFAQGLFEKTPPKVLLLKTLKEEDDILLRYDEHPCPDYDQKVTYNESLTQWLESFFDTPFYKKLMQDVQLHFNPDVWSVGAKDVLTFYKICIHEVSVLGRSGWCDLFNTEQLSILQFYVDLRTYWIKGGGHSITGKRSVHLVQAIFDFLMQGKQSVALSFAHAETILPLLTFLKAFPTADHLTPANFHEQKERRFVTSRMVPYSANIFFVLYDCQQDSNAAAAHGRYVRLLVNEEVVEMGLCGSHDAESEAAGKWADSKGLCNLDLLGINAYHATGGISRLTEICKLIQK